jgi:hypothetical protein
VTTEVDEKQVGYFPSLFVFCPLPYKNSGNVFIREYGKVTYKMYTAGKGVPYGKIGRSVLSLLTTQAVLQNDRHIELGCISDTARKLGIVNTTGGKTGNIGRITETFRQFGELVIANESTIRQGEIEGFKIGKKLVITDEMELYWNTKKRDEEETLPSLFENYMNLTHDFYTFIRKNAVPVDIVAYTKMQSPRAQDIYSWVVRRLYGLKESTTIPWSALYGQFADGIDRRKKPEFRKDFTNALLLAKAIYPEARIQADDLAGIRLSPSPAHIDPKNLGYV